LTEPGELTSSIYKGWHTYQSALINALEPLEPDQLALRATPELRSVGEIARHIIGARARWFHMLMGEGGEEFARLGKWDRRGERQRSASEIVGGIETTWRGMQDAIGGWTPEQWQQTYPGEDESEPEVVTRQWVIWHLIEHDLYHGGEISLTLGMHGVPAVDL
jgi:uncharacterized damage-inducible protein DinB